MFDRSNGTLYGGGNGLSKSLYQPSSLFHDRNSQTCLKVMSESRMFRKQRHLSRDRRRSLCS